MYLNLINFIIFNQFIPINSTIIKKLSYILVKINHYIQVCRYLF
jgi:hypothetical protein